MQPPLNAQFPFMKADAKGSMMTHNDMDPKSTKLGQMAEAEPKDKTEVHNLPPPPTSNPYGYPSPVLESLD